MNEDKLSPKQEAFVSAYLEDFNGTRAAEIAGYAFPAVEASKLLRVPKIRYRISEHLDSIRESGIANKAFRLAQLNKLFTKVSAIADETDLHQVAYTNQGKEYKVFAKEVTNELRALMEQAAREIGDRDKRIQLDADIKVETVSAKEKLLSLIEDED